MMTIIAVTMMRLLNGTMVIRPGRHKKPQQKNYFYPLPGIHQDIGIGVCQKTRKKRHKNCGGKYRPFCND